MLVFEIGTLWNKRFISIESHKISIKVQHLEYHQINQCFPKTKLILIILYRNRHSEHFQYYCDYPVLKKNNQLHF